MILSKRMRFLSLQNVRFQFILLLILHFTAITNGTLLLPKSLSLEEIHLVRSLTYISRRYFPVRSSLVISSPSEYRDLPNELIADIQRTTLWPVVVAVDGGITKPENTDFIDRDGSYIILIPDGNFYSFQHVIDGLAKRGRKLTRYWNSEARFVVAGVNEFSMSQKKDIFDYVSQFRIYNCIIVNQEYDLIENEYGKSIKVNDVERGKKFGVYTWIPYQSSDHCTVVNYITLLDSWVISAQGHFIKNTDLFPRKISNNLNGCPMKAVVRDRFWEFITKYVNHTDSNGSVVKYIEGLEMDLLRVVMQHMNMTFSLVPTPQEFEIDNVTNLVTGMFGKEIDIALGLVSTQILCTSFFESTNPHYIMSISWYVPCSIKDPRWSSIFRILSVELWVVLIISIVTMAISTTVLGRYSCMSEWQVYKTVASSLTNVWAVVLGVSVSTMPRASSLRWLFLAWVCFSVAFSTVFQAFLTTFLIDSGYKTPIRNKEELLTSGLTLAYPLTFSHIIENGYETDISKVRINQMNCPLNDGCLSWAKHYKNASVLLIDVVAEEFYAIGDFLSENSKPLICRLEDGVILNTGLIMIMLHGDPLMKRVSEVVDRVVEAGLYNYWNSQRMFRLELSTQKIRHVQPLDGYYSFNITHLQPAFYFLLMGLCISVVCFTVEFLYYRVLSKWR
jgi:hypothetical protein